MYYIAVLGLGINNRHVQTICGSMSNRECYKCSLSYFSIFQYRSALYEFVHAPRLYAEKIHGKSADSPCVHLENPRIVLVQSFGANFGVGIQLA